MRKLIASIALGLAAFGLLGVSHAQDAAASAPVAAEATAAPAPAADDQKANPTDSASTEDPPQEETPEQKEARRKARAQAHERRRLEKHIQAAADARAEANQLRQQGAPRTTLREIPPGHTAVPPAS